MVKSGNDILVIDLYIWNLWFDLWIWICIRQFFFFKLRAKWTFHVNVLNADFELIWCKENLLFIIWLLWSWINLELWRQILPHSFSKFHSNIFFISLFSGFVSQAKFLLDIKSSFCYLTFSSHSQHLKRTKERNYTSHRWVLLKKIVEFFLTSC